MTKSADIHFPNTFEIHGGTVYVQWGSERGTNVHITFTSYANMVCTFGRRKCVRKVDVNGFRHKIDEVIGYA